MRSRQKTPELHEKGTRNPYFWAYFLFSFISAGFAVYNLMLYYRLDVPSYKFLWYFLILTIVGVYFYSKMNKCKTLSLYHDRLIVHSTLGLYSYSIVKKQIRSWEEYEKEYDGTTWLELILFYGNRKIILSSLYYENYDGFKDKLTRNVKRGITGNFNFYGIGFGLFIMAIGAYITYKNAAPFIFKNPNFTYLDFTTLVDAKIQNIDRSNGESDFRFTIEGYPRIVFFIDSRSIQSSKLENFISGIKPEEKFYMDLLITDFIHIENRMKNPSILDRVFNHYEARVFGMRNQNAQVEVPFLHQLELENSRYDDKNLKLLLLGVSLIVLGIYLAKIKFGIDRST